MSNQVAQKWKLKTPNIFVTVLPLSWGPSICVINFEFNVTERRYTNGEIILKLIVDGISSLWLWLALPTFFHMKIILLHAVVQTTQRQETVKNTIEIFFFHQDPVFLVLKCNKIETSSKCPVCFLYFLHWLKQLVDIYQSNALEMITKIQLNQSLFNLFPFFPIFSTKFLKLLVKSDTFSAYIVSEREWKSSRQTTQIFHSSSLE